MIHYNNNIHIITFIGSYWCWLLHIIINFYLKYGYVSITSCFQYRHWTKTQLSRTFCNVNMKIHFSLSTLCYHIANDVILKIMISSVHNFFLNRYVYILKHIENRICFYFRSLTIPLPSAESASLARDVLSVDKELKRSGVQRKIEINAENLVV